MRSLSRPSRFGSRGLLLVAGLFGLAPLVTTSSALAQPVVVPPRVVQMPEPQPAAAPPEEVTVVLELLVGVDGRATDVKVVSEPRPPYDDDAVRAVSAATFEPATKDGVKTSARIRYSVVFTAAAPAPPPAPGPTAAPADAAPTAPDATPKAPVDAPPEKDQASFGARAVTEAPPREATARTMTGGELRMLGTRGDPLRAVEILPGMGRTSFGNPLPIIRGSAGFESQVFFEGMPVPLLYHFGGITSFVPARFLDRVDFYPGNFSARYGRVLGGVIDVRMREPKIDAPHGGADANFIDASAFVEGPLVGRSKEPEAEDPDKPRLSAAVGFRRSYVDLFFSALVPKDVITIEAAPSYYDYQGMVSAKLSRKHALRVIAIGSQDRFELVQEQPDDREPAARGRFDVRSAFHRLQVVQKSDWSSRFSHEAQVSLGIQNNRTNLGAFLQGDVDAIALRARVEGVYRPFDDLRLTVGLDHSSEHWKGTYSGSRPDLEGIGAAGPSSIPRTTVTANTWVHAPALYAEAALLLGGRVTLMPSIRADYLDQTGSLTVDPRFAVRAKLTQTTTLKGGVGRFTQHPQVFQGLANIGNPNIEPGYAMHYSVGVEQALGESVRLGAEGFLKTLHRLPFDTKDFAAPYFDNIGRGHVVGMEIEARVLPKGRFYGLLAYTLSRSERARNDEPLRLFQNDQTHVGSAAGVVRLGRGWEASATFRLTSANPRTPVTSAFYDARSDQYTPRNGAVFSDRGPIYHRLDVHLEKTWTFPKWKLMFYVDVQNVYNASNKEYVSYNYDYTKQQGSASFPPFLPSLGIRGEL